MLSTFQIAYSKQCKRHHAHHCVGTIIPITVQASTCSALHTLLKVMMCMADSQFATTPIGHTNDYSHDGKIVITIIHMMARLYYTNVFMSHGISMVLVYVTKAANS